MTRSSLPLLILACALLACTEEPTGSTPEQLRLPKTGDRFVYDTYDLDSSGVKIAGSESTKTLTVGSTGGTYLDSSGVLTLTMDADSGAPTIVRSNGDVGIVTTYTIGTNDFTFTAPLKWITLPFGSRPLGRIEVRSYDTSTTIGGAVASLSFKQWATYEGAQKLTIGSEEMETRKVLLHTEITWVGRGAGESITMDDRYWFAPRLGMIVKTDETRKSSQSPPFVRSGRTLRSYELK